MPRWREPIDTLRDQRFGLSAPLKDRIDDATQVACDAAARPNVDPQYQNHCVECALEYVGGGLART